MREGCGCQRRLDDVFVCVVVLQEEERDRWRKERRRLEREGKTPVGEQPQTPTRLQAWRLCG